jgi:hypothetical protein
LGFIKRTEGGKIARLKKKNIAKQRKRSKAWNNKRILTPDYEEQMLIRWEIKQFGYLSLRSDIGNNRE